MKIQNLHQVVRTLENKWADSHVLVVGDLMLDQYVWAKWAEPLPKLRFQS